MPTISFRRHIRADHHESSRDYTRHNVITHTRGRAPFRHTQAETLTDDSKQYFNYLRPPGRHRNTRRLHHHARWADLRARRGWPQRYTIYALPGLRHLKERAFHYRRHYMGVLYDVSFLMLSRDDIPDSLDFAISFHDEALIIQRTYQHGCATIVAKSIIANASLRDGESDRAFSASMTINFYRRRRAHTMPSMGIFSRTRRSRLSSSIEAAAGRVSVGRPSWPSALPTDASSMLLAAR